MTDTPQDDRELTGVDDVRRVREKIAREHGGDFLKHAEETTRIAKALYAKLKVRPVSGPAATSHPR